MRELNDALSNGVTIKVGGEMMLASFASAGGYWSMTTSFAEDAVSVSPETTAKREWSLVARLIADEGTWLHLAASYEETPLEAWTMGGDPLRCMAANQQSHWR